MICSVFVLYKNNKKTNFLIAPFARVLD